VNSSESRRKRIAEAAYYIAEQEGFPPGRELEHWLRAEAAIDRPLAGRSAAKAS
jgi:hypothetical protein